MSSFIVVVSRCTLNMLRFAPSTRCAAAIMFMINGSGDVLSFSSHPSLSSMQASMRCLGLCVTLHCFEPCGSRVPERRPFMEACVSIVFGDHFR